MRWGVRDEMTNEHMTTELCMRELASCQQLSIGLKRYNFLQYGKPTILFSPRAKLHLSRGPEVWLPTGTSYCGFRRLKITLMKYDYRPIPAIVDSAELKLLRETLVAMGTDVSLLDRSIEN